MKIGILGAGKLGLCFALNLERSGFDVVGVDVYEEYVKELNSKTYFSYEPKVNELLEQSTEFIASTHIEDVLINSFEVLFVMVATPSLPNGAYDHSQIERVVAQLIQHGKRERRVDLILGCTVMPGYCSGLQQKLLPYNYRVSYNPEFIAQGNIINNQIYPDQILIGEADKEAGDKIEMIYRKICRNNPHISRMDWISAEIAKLATNCFITTKISFANAIGDLAIRAKANPEKILESLGADSRIGKKYLQYGHGYGGPCFPRDNRALNLFAKNLNIQLTINEATDSVNHQHLQFLLEEYLRKYKEEEEIVFEEVTYKKGSIILEESQVLELAKQLVYAGRKVLIKEKPVVINELKNRYGDLFSYAPILLNNE